MKSAWNYEIMKVKKQIVLFKGISLIKHSN